MCRSWRTDQLVPYCSHGESRRPQGEYSAQAGSVNGGRLLVRAAAAVRRRLPPRQPPPLGRRKHRLRLRLRLCLATLRGGAAIASTVNAAVHSAAVAAIATAAVTTVGAATAASTAASSAAAGALRLLGRSLASARVAALQIVACPPRLRPRSLRPSARRRVDRRVVRDLGEDELADGGGLDLGVLEVDGRRVDWPHGDLRVEPVCHRLEEAVLERLLDGEPLEGLKSQHRLEQLERGGGRGRVELRERRGRQRREGVQVVSHLWQLDPAERALGRPEHRKDDVELVEVRLGVGVVLHGGERQAGAAGEEGAPVAAVHPRLGQHRQQLREDAREGPDVDRCRVPNLG
mmetsp:Transcript_2795/g.9165  ORF Transcript_2795/g.9165 Transcript_2795/m.9165 type:complete len:347 (+) Transcript_2795:283-1323(+)